jgi:hypothetical protein
MGTNYFLSSIILFLISITLCVGQTDTIKEGNIVFQLPNNNWKLKDIQKDKGETFYNYVRKPVTDNEGRLIIPTITFITEKIPLNVDIAKFADKQKANAPFKITEEFNNKNVIKKIKINNAIGWKCLYSQDNVAHTIYFVHLINKDKGIQVLMDITSELFEKYENEFIDAMLSIRAL